MRIRIRHETTYSYGAPVMLQPQRIRLRPREGPSLTLVRHELRLSPPVRPRWSLDADGNSVATCWFGRTTRTFEVTVEAEVSTTVADPYDFLLEPSAIELPIRLTPREQRLLAPSLERRVPPGRPDAVAALGAEVRASAGGGTVAFVAAACRAVNERVTWLRRARPDRQRLAFIYQFLRQTLSGRELFGLTPRVTFGEIVSGETSAHVLAEVGAAARRTLETHKLWRPAAGPG